MPMLADLRRLLLAGSQDHEEEQQGEVLVADTRARLSPSQQVEQKLRGALVSGQFVAVGLASIRQRPRPR